MDTYTFRYHGKVLTHFDSLSHMFYQGKMYNGYPQKDYVTMEGMATKNAIINDNNGPWIKMINQAVFTGNIKQAQATGQQGAQSLIDQGT